MTTLSDLRRASLQEQKDNTNSPPPPVSGTAPIPAGAAPVTLPSEVLTPAPIVTETRVPEDIPAPRVAKEEKSAAPTLILTTEADHHDDLRERVQEKLQHKMTHATGAKATVDMSPALFHRAKRYCLDHGNLTLRQVFLTLLTEFLDEEGY